jgi:hypothetical protein
LRKNDNIRRKKIMGIFKVAFAGMVSLTLVGCFESEACKQAKLNVGSVELDVIGLEEEYKTWSDAVNDAVRNRSGIDELDLKYRQEASWNLQMAKIQLVRAKSAQGQACGSAG